MYVYKALENFDVQIMIIVLRKWKQFEMTKCYYTYGQHMISGEMVKSTNEIQIHRFIQCDKYYTFSIVCHHSLVATAAAARWWCG